LVKPFFPSCCEMRSGVVIGVAWLLWLAACAGDTGEGTRSSRVLPWAGLEGRWVGPVIPIDPSCGLRTTGLMSIGSGAFAFDPFQSTDVLQGKIGPGGDLMGQAVRPALGDRPIKIDFLGRVQHSDDAARIVGTLTSGRCNWSVILHPG
jgi:hypothetical protein